MAMRKENQKAESLFKRAIEFIRNAFPARKPTAHHPFLLLKSSLHTSQVPNSEKSYLSVLKMRRKNVCS